MAVVRHPAVGGPVRPVVSVCIANYNGEQLLSECIDSVLAQDGDVAIEIIVHDDASSDGSLALLRARYPQIEVIASDENVGFCTANNRMAAAARGKYLLLLNNDAALYPDAIESLLTEAGAQPSVGILTLPQYDWQTGTLVDRGCLLDPFFNPVPNLDPTRHDVAYVIGACLFIDCSLWLRLGGFPEWMESIGEDLYLCGCARLRGMPVRVLATSGYRHRQGVTFGGNRIGETGLSTTIRRRRLSECNKTRALMILTPGTVVWPLLALHLSTLAAEGAVLSLVRRDGTLWREVYAPALATPFREARDLQAHRRRVQGQRIITTLAWFSTTRWQLRKLVLLLNYGFPQVS